MFFCQGLGGVFAALINIVLLAAGGSDVKAAFNCFLLSIIFLVGSVVAFVAMSRTAFYRHYTKEVQQQQDEHTSLLQDKPDAGKDVGVVAVLKSIWEEAVTVFLIYLVTLACFPAITVLVQSTGNFTFIAKYVITVCQISLV